MRLIFGNAPQETLFRQSLVSRENDDLLRLYTFINLANSLLTYTWLFRGVEDYPDASEDAHIFTSNLTRLTAMGVRIWKETEGGLPSESVDERYIAGEPPLLTLREMLAAMQAEDEELKHENQRAAFVIARLAALRAALAAYLTVDYSWAIALTEKRTITSEFDRDLDYASALAPDHPDLPSLVRRNLGELMTRYRCGWLPVDEPSSQTEDNDKNNDQS